eukprot:TRINITY_DN7129_c0_g1_i1.p1 TRINITY_DN7129_c0_g1~~TRINITY_DN7129_c0_g1_i1.p1  ORF type:complete len:222 (+),score=61.07 TRINITY_DN7129_c0_g1_i1:80-745(+)
MTKGLRCIDLTNDFDLSNLSESDDEFFKIIEEDPNSKELQIYLLEQSSNLKNLSLFSHLIEQKLWFGVAKLKPIVLTGPVVHGFGRGSRLLGFPTANIDYEPEKTSAGVEFLADGVYFGYSYLNFSNETYKMVISVGKNPSFNNEEKTFEAHILHEFKEDFYGEIIQVAITHYVRPQIAFDSLDKLVSSIRNDISLAEEHLVDLNFESPEAFTCSFDSSAM